MKKLSVYILVTFAFALANAATGNPGTSSMKPEKTWGTYLAIGNPYPSIIGLNVAYNLNKNIRANLGYGEIEVTTSLSFSENGFSEEKTKATTYSLGADYLFLDSGFRPLVGARVGYFSIKGDGEFEIQGLNKSTALIYSNLGIEWMAQGGFYVGSGFNVALLGGSGANFYANLGYFY